MSTLAQRLASFAAAVAADIKSHTNALAGKATINDAATTGSSETWSVTKITQAIATAKSELVNGAGAALDTFAEVAAQLAADQSAASALTTAVGNRIRYDAAQSLTAGQITQACANLGLGEPDTDLVAVYNAAKA